VHNHYYMIRRWQHEQLPESIRMLAPGTAVKLHTGVGIYTVDHVGLRRVLLNGLGWVDWREIDLASAEG